jgi:tellurite resistance protein TehA-like permease
MKLESMAKSTFLGTGTLHPDAGEITYAWGAAVAIVMWGFGLVWLFVGVASILYRRKISST